MAGNIPVWQLRLFSTDPDENHELYVEVQAPTFGNAVTLANKKLFGTTWFVDEDHIQEKTGSRRYEVGEPYEVQVVPDPEELGEAQPSTESAVLAQQLLLFSEDEA